MSWARINAMFILALALFATAPWASPLPVAGKLAIDGIVALVGAGIGALSKS